LVEQYTTQRLLGKLVQRIDDIEVENFSVPNLKHQQRVRVMRDHDVVHNGDYKFSETDYADARVPSNYNTDWMGLRSITDAAQVKTLTLLNKIIRGAINKQTVTLSQLKRVLTAQQYRDFQSSLTEIHFASEVMYGDGMPDVLKQYNIMLRDADFAWNKFESKQSKAHANNKPRNNSNSKARYSADALYERALERLEEVFSCANGELKEQLRIWMDRDVDFEKGFDRKINIDVGSMPRVRGSKSHNALDSGLPKLSKRLKQQYCALIALLGAAYIIAFKAEQQETATQNDSAELTAKVKMLLQRMNKENDD
jgi:hypothetical protein